MDYKKKYEDVLERARAIYQGKYKPETAATIAETLQSIFPELAEPVESEDEKIRKDLINWVKTNMSYERMPVGMNYSNECVLAWLEKQGEQKPTPAVEPRFKIGDWVVVNNKHQSIYQVEKIEDGYYTLVHTYGGTFRVCVLHDESLRFWTIEDAKDGDVLACVDKASCCPFIFHNLTEELNPRSYCGVNTVHQFQVNDENGGYWCRSDEAVPATKEQRELLFAKMKEAGYEWDSQSKQILRIN